MKIPHTAITVLGLIVGIASSFQIAKSKEPTIWFLVAPVSMGVAYTAWAKKSEDDRSGGFYELEEFKNRLISNRKTASIDTLDERVGTIVWVLSSPAEEGFCTNSCFRIINEQHEQDFLKMMPDEYIIGVCVADATALCCPLDRFSHEHGCYSVV